MEGTKGINQESIKHRTKLLDGIIKRAYDYKASLKESCTHPNATGEHGSNTGNWCSQDDSYWISCSCPDCGKRWRIDSDKDPEGYRLFKM